MVSVTKRIKMIKQPRGGYIHPKSMNITDLPKTHELYSKENINPGLVGTVVDYLTRFQMGAYVNDAFKVSLIGASVVNELSEAKEIINKIHGLDEESVFYACQLVGYDVCCRNQTGFIPVKNILPNKETIYNIQEMVHRSLLFFKDYGPIVLEGFTFENVYTHYIHSGDGDFLTETTLWDFKVSTHNPTKIHTLQILVYYLMGLRSEKSTYFESIQNLGIYNPRLQKVYLINIDEIPQSIIEDVCENVIGYDFQ